MRVGNEIYGTFNWEITMNTGTLKVFKDNALYLTFTDEDITVVGGTFSVDVTGMLTENGEYTVQLSEGLFSSFVGDSGLIEWNFTLGEADFINTDWNTSDFFTN